MDEQQLTNLRNAWINAERFFWCNTGRGLGPDRNNPNGNVLETLMHNRGFAAIWTGGNTGLVRYPDEMHRVRCYDLIFMYAIRRGIIGVGAATDVVSALNQDNPDRLRNFAFEGRNENELRIPVSWLTWHEERPCAIPSSRSPIIRPYLYSFHPATNDCELLQIIWRHYFREEPYPPTMQP